MILEWIDGSVDIITIRVMPPQMGVIAQQGPRPGGDACSRNDSNKHVQVFRCMLDKKQPLFKILQTERGKMLAIENIFEPDVELRRNAPCRELGVCRGRMEQAILEARMMFFMSLPRTRDEITSGSSTYRQSKQSTGGEFDCAWLSLRRRDDLDSRCGSGRNQKRRWREDLRRGPRSWGRVVRLTGRSVGRGGR